MFILFDTAICLAGIYPKNMTRDVQKIYIQKHVCKKFTYKNMYAKIYIQNMYAKHVLYLHTKHVYTQKSCMQDLHTKTCMRDLYTKHV